MDDIYMLADTAILNRIGNKLKATRLKQNVSSAVTRRRAMSIRWLE